jgi:hypothetical protein
MKKFISLLFVILFVAVTISIAQEKTAVDQMKDHETTAEVPALAKFHKVIYPIWHKYFPSKDYEGLKNSIPDIEKYAEDIYKSELPGILRDKKKAWSDAIASLKENIADYKSAAEKNENEKLLNAAEKLHSQYEKMVRIVKPMVKELDAFHIVLYNIYHKFLPEFKLSELKKAVPVLAERKDTLMAVKLKFRQETDKTKEKAKAELGAAVDELVKVMASDDKDKIKKAIEKVHTKYQATEKVFD